MNDGIKREHNPSPSLHNPSYRPPIAKEDIRLFVKIIPCNVI